jgi:hypothetical protein
MVDDCIPNQSEGIFLLPARSSLISSRWQRANEAWHCQERISQRCMTTLVHEYHYFPGVVSIPQACGAGKLLGTLSGAKGPGEFSSHHPGRQ